MVRVRIIKSRKQYKAGETVEVTPNEAHGLIDGGFAVISKDMVTDTDYATKAVKRLRKAR